MKKGLTLIELVIALGMALILVTTGISLYLGNNKNNERARDIKRLADISILERAINEYKLDNNSFPDDADVYRTSSNPPAASEDPANASLGWINEDLSSYTSKLPIDPVNDDQYYYSYIHNGSTYELNAKLEYLTEEMENDGGNDDNLYESGDNLLLISP